MSEKTPQRRRRGAQPGNSNSLTHGVYASDAAIDHRTKASRAIQSVRESLILALGGDPSPQERLLIDRAAFAAWRVATLEALLLSSEETPEDWQDMWHRWSSALARDLKLVGLSRRARPVQDLHAYLAGYATEAHDE